MTKNNTATLFRVDTFGMVADSLQVFWTELNHNAIVISWLLVVGW
jgi:hypothetical protein